MTARGPRVAAALLVVVAACALYAPTIDDYFLQDDFGVVALFSQRSLANVPKWFVSPWTEDVWGYVPDEIRPFPAMSYVVTSWFGAASPEPNHILNIGIHALNGLLVMWIAEAAAGLALVPAMVAGLMFVLLPIQAESVAWVTGRVDSLPACLYFAAFLLYVRWRHGAGTSSYLWSLAVFFAALFTKQNTITLGPALVAFDLLVDRRRIEVSWQWLRPYVPYVLVTGGFLLLRYVIFHEVAREDTLTSQRFQEFLSDSSRHLARLVFGGAGVRHWSMRDTAIVATGAIGIAAMAWRFGRARGAVWWRSFVYFGGVWLALGMAPILVSGYYSPRHMYLAALGWAVAIGIAVDVTWSIEPRRVTRRVAALAAAAFAIAYAVQLHGVVRDWGDAAAISQAAVTQIEHEAMTTPEGTLLIAGVPRMSWAFAVPFSVRPPFTARRVTDRIYVISDTFDHCCNAVLWNQYTEQALQGWHRRTDHPPVIALYWDPHTGRMSRVTDHDDPQLQTLATLLLDIKSRESLDSAIRGLLNDYVALR